VLDELLGAARPAVFLDYDGVLAEIVTDPGAAVLTPPRREAVAALAARCPVAVVSGRDLPDVRDLVALDGLVYAGSHGFDIAGPDGLAGADVGADAYLPALAEAEGRLTRVLSAVPGLRVERKRFAVTVHTRNVARPDLGRV
jgi:trehalose-phosphatase